LVRSGARAVDLPVVGVGFPAVPGDTVFGVDVVFRPCRMRFRIVARSFRWMTRTRLGVVPLADGKGVGAT
jgi:hypothetical protein